MKIDLLWDELRKQQEVTQNKELFEKYYKIFIDDFIVSLNNYKNYILSSCYISNEKYKELSTHIEKTKELNQLQLAIFYHARAIERPISLLNQLLTKKCPAVADYKLLQADKIWSQLPKLDIAKEFVADNITRYGKFLAELQVQNPDVFTAQNLILTQAQRCLALSTFHSLRRLFPNVLSSQGLAQHTSRLLNDIVKNAHIETQHPSKYRNLFLYFKQATKDTALNIIFSLLESFNIDILVAQSFAHFLIDKTDEIDEKRLSRDVIELNDLSYELSTPINTNYIPSYVTQIRQQRFNDIDSIIKNITNELSSSCFDINKIIFLLDKLAILTPLPKAYPEGLKDHAYPKKKLLFIDENVLPIIKTIKYHIKTSTHPKQSIIRHLQELNLLLDYSKNITQQQTQQIISRLTANLELARSKPSLDNLHKTITELSLIIKNNTSRNIFGIIKRNQAAKDADNYRKELLLLLKNKSEIALKRAPVPYFTQWDKYLVNDFSAPLHPSASWSNCFFAFTAIGTIPHLPGLLSDQLKTLSKLITIRNILLEINYNNYNTLPNIESTETSNNRISGTVHLQQLADRLLLQINSLKNFILYLQFSSINAILNKVPTPSAELTVIQGIIKNWLADITYCAQYRPNELIIPTPRELEEIQTKLKDVASKQDSNTTATKNNIEKIIDSLNNIGAFYHLKSQQNSPLSQVPSSIDRKFVTINEISLLRKIVISILTLCQSFNNVVVEPVKEFVHRVTGQHKAQESENTNSPCAERQSEQPKQAISTDTPDKQLTPLKKPYTSYYNATTNSPAAAAPTPIPIPPPLAPVWLTKRPINHS